MQLVRLARAGTLAALVAATAAVAAPAGAQNVIDQQQTVGVGAFGGISNWNAQTFTPGAANVSGAGFLLENGGTSTGSATIGLWTDAPAAGGQLLASGTGTFTIGALRGATAWFDLFWAPTAVTAGQTYWLLIGAGPQGVETMNANATTYANGGAWYNYSPSAGASFADFGTGYDLAFRTYADVTPAGAPSVTPEPASVALLGTGLAGLGVVVRRRRRA